MSKAKLKKELVNLEKEELVDLILEIYANRKDARDWLEFWLDPDSDKEADRVKESIRKIYFSSSDQARTKPDQAAAKTLLKNFKSICSDPGLLTDIMIFSCEEHCKWILLKKKFLKGEYNKVVKQIEEIKENLSDWGETSLFDLRIEKLQNTAEYISEEIEERANSSYGYRRRRRWFY